MAKQKSELFSSLYQGDFVLTIYGDVKNVCFRSKHENLTWQGLGDSYVFDFYEKTFKVLDVLMSQSWKVRATDCHALGAGLAALGSLFSEPAPSKRLPSDQ